VRSRRPREKRRGAKNKSDEDNSWEAVPGSEKASFKDRWDYGKKGRGFGSGCRPAFSETPSWPPEMLRPFAIGRWDRRLISVEGQSVAPTSPSAQVISHSSGCRAENGTAAEHDWAQRLTGGRLLAPGTYSNLEWPVDGHDGIGSTARVGSLCQHRPLWRLGKGAASRDRWSTVGT
jgi:hypothetical protein